MANLNTIKNWFKTGLKPTQLQFWDTLESFWHKDDTISVANIDGIDNLLNQKANKSVVDAHLIDTNAHNDLFNAKEDKSKKGQADGYAPLNEFGKILGEYLVIVDDLVTGGRNAILSAEQGAILSSQISAIYTLLASDNVQLDNVQELVDAIESLQVSLNAILVNDLTTGGITKALTAEQGKQLKQLIDTLNSSVIDLTSSQTISGQKTFTKSITIMGTSLTPFRAWSAGGGIEYGSQWIRSTNMYGSMLRVFLGTTRNDGLEKNISFPDKNGTVLVEDGTGITCAKFIKAGGTGSEFLKADGTVDTVAYAPQTVVDNKVDKITGKGLSTEDFTAQEKAKLAELQNSNEQILFNTGHYALLNQTAYQKIFSTGELSVVAGKTYIFRMELSLYQFSTYGRAASFSMLGTANVSHLHLNYTTVLNGNTPQTYADLPIFPDNGYFTNGQMGWSGTVYIKGSFTASIDGTFIPAIKFDALPGASLQATAGSYFILKKIN
jgi:hypothetical protein